VCMGLTSATTKKASQIAAIAGRRILRGGYSVSCSLWFSSPGFSLLGRSDPCSALLIMDRGERQHNPSRMCHGAGMTGYYNLVTRIPRAPQS
jgi:hypothetical protein